MCGRFCFVRRFCVSARCLPAKADPNFTPDARRVRRSAEAIGPLGVITPEMRLPDTPGKTETAGAAKSAHSPDRGRFWSCPSARGLIAVRSTAIGQLIGNQKGQFQRLAGIEARITGGVVAI